MTQPQSNPSNEEWRDIPGHPNYQASSLGRIRNKLKGNILVPKRSPSSRAVYWKVDLGWAKDPTERKKKRNQYIHRLVSLAFHGSAGENTDHGDRDTSNNALSNLTPMTVEQNQGRRKVENSEADEEGAGGSTDFNFK